MIGALLGAGVVLLLAGTGLLTAATLGVRSTAELVLGAYVVAFGAVVGLSLFLSVFDGITRGSLVAGSVLLFVGAVAVWLLAGARRIPLVPRVVFALFPRRGPALVLAIVVALALAYVFALIVGTPPNGWDPLNYHLARVAFWLQSGRIGYIEPTYDERMNLNPPNAEIGSAFALGVTRDEMAVGFVQFFAVLACAAAVFALARRIGLTRSEAGFGLLLFLSLPIVALQSSLAKNDLVLASFLLAASVFILGDRRRDIALASLAIALAVSTKSTAFYGVAVLLAIALVARPGTWRISRFAGIAVGTLIGSYWYVVNAVDSGSLLGDQSAQQSVTAIFRPPEDVLTAYGMAVDTLDLSGSRGKDILIYGIAALVLGIALLRRREGWKLALLGTAAVASPLLLLELTEHVGRPSFVHLYNALGKPDGYLAIGSEAASPMTASDTASWFGSVGLLFVIGAAVGSAVLLRRGAVSRLAGVFAFAPLGWFLLVALTLSYNPFLGRFFVFPVGLSATLWGRALRWPTVAWAATALGTITLVLTLVHYQEKPSGVRLLDGGSSSSVWSMPRWEVQSQHDPPLGPVLRFLDDDVAQHASIALALSENDFGYPVFGPHLDRRVVVVPEGSNARNVRADWLFASSERAPQIDSSCWHAAFESSEGSVFQRSASCA